MRQANTCRAPAMNDVETTTQLHNALQLLLRLQAPADMDRAKIREGEFVPTACRAMPGMHSNHLRYLKRTVKG